MDWRLETVVVPVSDVDRAKAFYVDTLGFELVADTEMGPGQRWVQVKPSGGETSITLVTWFESMPPGSLTGTVLGCEDLEQTLEELSERGVVFAEDKIQEAPWGRWKTFTDPDGNGWVLQQNTAGFAP